MRAPQTWHHGLIADWWANFNLDSPEVELYRPYLQNPVLNAGCGAGRLLVPLLAAGYDIDGYLTSKSGKGEPPFKDWRDRVDTMGPGWESLPKEWWGSDDWKRAQATNRPMNLELLPGTGRTRAAAGLHPLRQAAGQAHHGRACATGDQIEQG